MDPISLIVTAVVLGAAAGLKPTAEQAVKDAYAGLKALIQRKFVEVDLSPVEKKPESDAKQKSLEEDLQAVGASEDAEVLAQAEAVVNAAEQSPQAQAVAATLKINLTEAKAGFFKLKSAQASGAVDLNFTRSEIPGGIDLGDLTAGRTAPN